MESVEWPAYLPNLGALVQVWDGRHTGHSGNRTIHYTSYPMQKYCYHHISPPADSPQMMLSISFELLASRQHAINFPSPLFGCHPFKLLASPVLLLADVAGPVLHGVHYAQLVQVSLDFALPLLAWQLRTGVSRSVIFEVETLHGPAVTADEMYEPLILVHDLKDQLQRCRTG